MHTFPATSIDTALSCAKRTFLQKHTDEWKRFPPSRRELLSRIKKLTPFWHHISHSLTIDVSHFRLPSETKSVDFHFIDPLWAWLRAARRQDPAMLHWKPTPGGGYYGGGVQYGEAFQHACRSCPPGSYPMCIGLHWDGTFGKSLSFAPICVGVANTNVCDSSTQFCIGYMPHVPDEKRPGWKELEVSTKVKFFLRQQCASAILRVIETAAEYGVFCRLRNHRGVEVKRLMFPRLLTMNFDQPEAQLFFGLQNKQSCSKCIRRKGYSAFRESRMQNGIAVKRLYSFANNPGPHQVSARAKLKRWGFNYKRKCCMLDVCNHLLVRVPSPDGREEVFPSIDYRDKMHGMMIMLHRFIMETLQYMGLSKALKRLLESRLAYISARRCFRDPDDKAYRLQRTMFSDVGMTAQDKVCLIFLLPHVLGPQATVIPNPRLRAPLLTAIAHAQLMLIAARGGRSYSRVELKTIFDKGNLMYFSSLETIWDIVRQHRLHLHETNPDDNPAPKRFKRQQKDEIHTDTEDTSDENTVGGLGVYSHGQKCLPHQHWVMQVISAGCFDVHNTQSAEAAHKLCAKLSASRVRHLGANTTQHSMLTYLCYHGVFEELADLIPEFHPTIRSNKLNPGVMVPLLQTGQMGCRYVPTTMHMDYLFSSARYEVRLN